MEYKCICIYNEQKHYDGCGQKKEYYKKLQINYKAKKPIAIGKLI